MKIPSRTIFFFTLLFLVWPLCVAQTPADCDQLRGNIDQLKVAELSMSPSLQHDFEEWKLKVYIQFSKCLEQDISAALRMRNIFAGTAAAKDAEAKIQALTKEKSDTDEEIAKLQKTLNHAEGTQPTDGSASERSSSANTTSVGRRRSP